MTQATVGIVSYSTPQATLQPLIVSLKASTLPLRIVLLSNADSAEYTEGLRTFAAEAKVDFMTMPNRGFGAAHNQIIAATTTPWYICCNPDIVVAPDAIEQLLAAQARLPDGMLFAPKVMGEDGQVQQLCRQHPTLSNWLLRQAQRFLPARAASMVPSYESMFDYHREQPVAFVSGAFFAARLETLRQLGGFDEAFFLYFEDADLSRRAETLGRNYFIPSAVVVHAWGQAWKHSLQILKIQLKSLWLYFCKHGWIS